MISPHVAWNLIHTKAEELFSSAEKLSWQIVQEPGDSSNHLM